MREGTLRRLIAFMSVLVLGGCMETAAQRENARMQTESGNALATGKECLQSAFDKPDYSGIKQKSYFSAVDQNWPLPMLNDPTLPSKEQIKQLYAIYADIQECRKIILDGAGKTHPTVLMAWVQNFSESDRLWAEFTRGKMEWGKFNEGRKSLAVEAQARLVQAATQINGQLQSEHQSELDQRQRAAAAFSQWAEQQQAIAVQQQAIAAANRPRTINCNYYGNTASCNSN
jgi:PBP1b-binding outer membrane lipoprotein LpoB